MTVERTGSGGSRNLVHSGTLLWRLRRIIIAIFLAVVVFFVDFAVLKWVVPWAHEQYKTVYGSGGYVVLFFTALLTVTASLALITYVLQHESYPSDRWQ